MNRRELLIKGTTVIAGTAAGFGGISFAQSRQPNPQEFTIQKARHRIRENITQEMVSLSNDGPPPVIRMRQGHLFTANLTNALPDYTAMHWHGLRLPNDMDGVPYLTQFPIKPNETFKYQFTPPDAGTYWYHPHCMTMNQMARGLTGIIVVEDEVNAGFDSDLPLNLRDFRLGSDDQFIELFTPRGAARSGTLGTVMTTNWKLAPTYERPTGSTVRLRIAATDMTRIYKLVVSGADGQIVALDGHPLIRPNPLPTAEHPVWLSPGQRADAAIVMPYLEGQEVVVSTIKGGTAYVLARIRATGPDQKRRLADIAPLKPNPVAEPDLSNAQIKEFVFGWTPEGGPPNYGVCGSFGYTFWSINRKPWPGDAVDGTAPLAELKLGRSYILRLRNESPNRHPIHLHGLTFKVIRSNKRKVSDHWTDTALLLRNEVLDLAVVADNPGDWAFHCHVIEHQKAGLAGFIRVV